jgi:threonine dehydrogenase-like Zn-dependent dehydrogenase
MNKANDSARAIAFTACRRAELINWPVDDAPLKPNEVAGRTLITAVSPGTEVNSGFDRDQDPEDPDVRGYAAVFEVEATGDDVKHIRPGQRAFAMGKHMSRQRHDADWVVPVPDGLKPADAVFVRLIAVGWATLTTTAARPPDRVLVTGLGIVGNCAAQLFQAAGYRVTAVDPLEDRRRLAQQCGIIDVRDAAPLDDPELKCKVSLAIECSGHEPAVLDSCHIVRKGGEVALVGMPWKRKSDISITELLQTVFHDYVHLRSGWEWELPMHPQEFTPGSTFANLHAAMQWLADGRLTVAGLYCRSRPDDAQKVYEEMFDQSGEALTHVFDWT